MKRSTLVMTVSIMMLFAAATVLAAGVNFSGTWVRDKDKSDPPMMGGGRGPGGPGGGGGQRPGGGGGRGMADAEVTLVLKQTANELSLTRKITAGGQERPAMEQKFTLDGKENINSSGRGELKSKSKWNKDKLVIEGTQKVNTPNGEFEIEVKEEYSLSADGKVLTVATTRTTPMGEQTGKQVYNKQ